MLKRFIPISLVAIVASFILLLSAVPHHHHGDAMCVSSEKCLLDNKINDVHTGHHESTNDTETCIVRHFFSQKGGTNALTSFLFLSLLFPLVCLFASSLYNSIFHSGTLAMYIVPSCPKVHAKSLGLRAPPYLM